MGRQRCANDVGSAGILQRVKSLSRTPRRRDAPNGCRVGGRTNVTLNLKSEGGEVADGGRLRHADRTPSSGLKLNEGISR